MTAPEIKNSRIGEALHCALSCIVAHEGESENWRIVAALREKIVAGDLPRELGTEQNVDEVRKQAFVAGWNHGVDQKPISESVVGQYVAAHKPAKLDRPIVPAAAPRGGEPAPPARCNAAAKVPPNDSYLWECTLPAGHNCDHLAGTVGNVLVWRDDATTINPLTVEVVRRSSVSSSTPEKPS